MAEVVEVDNEDQIVIVNAPASHKSTVWKQFGFLKDDKKKVVCRLCKATLTYSGNTTNMTTHLRRHHKITQTSLTATSNQTTLNSKVVNVKREEPSQSVLTPSPCQAQSSPGPSQTSIVECFKSKHLTVQQKDAITVAILNFMVQDLRPFRIVESQSFSTLISLLEPRYKMPSRQFFSESLLPKLYEEVKSLLVVKLQEAVYVALTTDGCVVLIFKIS